MIGGKIYFYLIDNQEMSGFHNKSPINGVGEGNSLGSSTRQMTAAIKAKAYDQISTTLNYNQTEGEKLAFNLNRFRDRVQRLVTIEQLGYMRNRWKNNFGDAYAEQVLQIIQTKEDNIEAETPSLGTSIANSIRNSFEKRVIKELVDMILGGKIEQYIVASTQSADRETLGRRLLDARKDIKKEYGKGSMEHIKAQDAYKKRKSIDSQLASRAETHENNDTGLTPAITGSKEKVNNRGETSPKTGNESTMHRLPIRATRKKLMLIEIQHDQLFGLSSGQKMPIQNFEHLTNKHLKVNVNGTSTYKSGKQNISFIQGKDVRIYTIEVILPNTLKIISIKKKNNKIVT